MSAVSGEQPRTGRFPVLAKYDVLEELGHGGMATVYRAHDKRLARDVAIKVIHPHLRDSGEVARRFSIEAQAVAKLRHPNIVEVYDVSAEGEGEQYLVVELLLGRTLRKLLQARGAIPPEVAASIGVELLGALGHAHGHGVIHRDVKPENVIIEHRQAAASSTGGAPNSAEAVSGEVATSSGTPSGHPAGSTRSLPPGDRISVKLTDFGIAKLLDAQGMTSTGQVLGSPAHMAPEQIEGQEVDGRADVFGMGVLLYECMVGHLPFEGNNPAQVLRRVLDGIYPNAERERPIIGKTWSLILDRALGRTPEERYPDSGGMRDALVAELKRLKVTDTRAEIEAYYDDPEGYAARQEKTLVPLLCERALDARKRGDALAAAADYNRALAYAPHDPALLRIVTTMHTAARRRDAIRRVAPLVLGTVLLGSLAYVVTDKLRPHHEDVVPPLPSVEVNTPAVVADHLPLPPPAVSVSSATLDPKTPGTGGSTQGAKPNGGPTAPTGGKRELHLSEVSPANIVQVTIDGHQVVSKLSTDTVVPLDGEAHKLVFSCSDRWAESCKPETKTVEAGSGAPPAMAVHLTLQDAKILIHGDLSKRYSVAEEPSVMLSADVASPIRLTGGFQRTVHVVEIGSGKQEPVTVTAGKTADVTF